MGREEKENIDSTWYKKRNQTITGNQESANIAVNVKPHSNRLVGFIKKVLKTKEQ